VKRYEGLFIFNLAGKEEGLKDALDKVSADIGKVLHGPEAKKSLNEQGAEPEPNSAPVFTKFVEAEVKKWLDLGKAANIKLSN